MNRPNYMKWCGCWSEEFQYEDAAAVEVLLETEDGAPLFEDSALRECAFERPLFDRGLRGCCLLPDRLRLLYDRTVDLLPVLRSLKIQTEEYAELYGAPEGCVWQAGFRFRLIATHEDLVATASALLQVPIERGLAECVGGYKSTLSAFHDDEGRLLGERPIPSAAN